ncbi:resolvase [Vasconcelosia minhoensis]|uniref:resolvase n=1 Tax=Vasconcelosia minhoensis TaxID=3366354 RepID=UPI001D13A9B6|nr:resolvase [Romeria gracilis]
MHSSFSQANDPSADPSRVSIEENHLLSVDAVQKILNRSRASVYRYANTDPLLMNPPFDPNRLNPEIRDHKEAALMFHPNEVARFAQDVLGIKQVTIEVSPPAETVTHQLLQQILAELQSIRALLKAQS